MVSVFAPPELFSAYAFAEDGSDADLGQGTHLRVFAGLGASFPVMPFAVFRVRSRGYEPHSIHATDRDGRIIPQGFSLANVGSAEATLTLGDDDFRRTVRIELASQDGRIDGAILLDQRSRIIAQRDKPRWLFSAPLLHRVRVWGDAPFVRITTRVVDLGTLLERERLDLAGILGFPIEGRHPWYVGGQNRGEAIQRVASGAPLRLNPMDRADGPFSPVGSTEEVARVEAMLKSLEIGAGVENLLATLVDYQPLPPWAQFETQDMQAAGGRRQIAHLPRHGTLQMAASDPGIARFLGFADRYDDYPDLDGQGWDTLAVVGLFALSPRDFDKLGLDLGSLHRQPAFGADQLLEQLIRALEASGRTGRDQIEEVIAWVRSQGLVAAPFVALAAPVPPWLPPSLPEPDTIEHRWQATPNAQPSALYRASFTFPGMPLVSMSALASRPGATWMSRHDFVPVGNVQPPTRARPGIFGHEQEERSRINVLHQAISVFERAGLLADQDIPAGAGQIDYRARASDCFGRFGEPVEFEIGPPDRPAPPPPVLRAHIAFADIDLASELAQSPGTLKLTVAAPRAWPADRFGPAEVERLGTVIVVPRIDDLAAGSLLLATLELGLGGQSKSVALSTPGFFDVEFDLPALLPQEKKSWTLTGLFRDTANVASGLAALPVEVTDRRPPKVYPSGIGLFWTSAPGPSPEVELKLKWPAAPGTLHRVYLADQHGLGLTDQDLADEWPEAEPSRGRVAAIGCRKVLDHGPAISRNGFRLITNPPVKAGAAGAALETRLPRSLETVQFLRVVPLGPDGAEPAFATCGIVPVAVPESRRPPMPRLDGEIDPATGAARLTVSTDGLDRVALERDEPGLFDPSAAGKEAPQARIRRAIGKVADPIYARTIGNGTLALDPGAAGVRFACTITDDNAGQGLEPFVRYIYWADVRLPPERRLPANFIALDPPGGVTALDPSGAQSHPRPMSLPSPPRVLMHVPSELIAPPDLIADGIEVVRMPPSPSGAVEFNITVNNPPQSHRQAIDFYRLAVWVQWSDSAIQPITNANGEELNGTWPVIADGYVSTILTPPTAAGELKLKMAYVDPIGRSTGLTPINVA